MSPTAYYDNASGELRVTLTQEQITQMLYLGSMPEDASDGAKLGRQLQREIYDAYKKQMEKHGKCVVVINQRKYDGEIV